MTHLLTDPAVWASFLSLTILEIVLGVDNVIFISIAASRLPERQQALARFVGLSGALVLRIGLLFSITWIIGLSDPIGSIAGFEFSWRDLILIAGGLFLLYKASTEIFAEVEGGHERAAGAIARAAFATVIVQIMILDLVFSFDSVITAVGIADELAVMVAAMVVAIGIMMVAATPVANFVQTHPSTKMLALAFLVMVGMALVADGLHVHVERSIIYAAMVFSGAVEALNLWRQKRRRAHALPVD